MGLRLDRSEDAHGVSETSGRASLEKERRAQAIDGVAQGQPSGRLFSCLLEDSDVQRVERQRSFVIFAAEKVPRPSADSHVRRLRFMVEYEEESCFLAAAARDLYPEGGFDRRPNAGLIADPVEEQLRVALPGAGAEIVGGAPSESVTGDGGGSSVEASLIRG